jgi:hypothetical protein
MAEEDTPGFLGRWARRKTDAAQGKSLAEPAPPEVAVTAKAAIHDTTPQPVAERADAQAVDPGLRQENIPPPLTLDDVKVLTKDSDFTPFMATHVGADVRNAAMKKLFADPHFNIMDGLDIYIDDYSKSDPIPEAMLRQMNGAKFLNLFTDEEDADAAKNPAPALPRENANDPQGQTVAQSQEAADIRQPDPPIPDNASQPESLKGSGASQENHADLDLRLQPDHAAPAPDAGRGTQ